MKLKNESEIACLLGSAFSGFANRVQNGFTAPFKALLDSDVVEVTLRVSSSGYVEWVQPVVEPIICMPTSDEPIYDLTVDNPFETSLLDTTVIAEEPPKLKPKRKRKPKTKKSTEEAT